MSRMCYNIFMNNLLLQDLNPKQIEAVQTIDGPVLIIAGAGSGKTKTLTHRIAYLIKEKGVNPQSVLAVTFTNKAAGEMKERVMKLLNVGEGHPQGAPLHPVIGTFHSVCVRILRREAKNLGVSNNFVIYDADDQSSLIKESLKELNISTDQFKPSSILASISMAKNKLESPADFAQNSGGYFESVVAKCYELYQDKLSKAEALDFDDLIMKIVLALKNNLQILEKYQNIFKFILVDEYQDTSHLQYELINLLAKKHQNLCVVGDDWQSIYKWRGADIANILEFERDYPSAKVILLEQNYRSSQNILDASYGIISKNVNRKDKKLWSTKEKGSAISIAMVSNEKEEGYFIVEKIREIVIPPLPEGGVFGSPPSGGGVRGGAQPLQYKDFAVLYRTNAQSRALEEAFIASGVPYKIVGGLKFYSRKEVKDVLAYLRLILNPYDKVSIARVINLPQRGLGKTTVDKLLKTLEASDRNQSLEEIKIDGVDSSKQKAINSFFKLLFVCKEKSKEFSLTKLIDFLLTASGYGSYIQSVDEGEARWENIQELFTAAAKFDALPCEEALRAFLEEVALVADTDELEPTNNVVNLMTLHSSKGLEFKTVFITGIEEGILPHSRTFANNPEDLEEERRLCYVGMTRAKERLFLIYTQMRTIYGSTVLSRPSRFLRDIPEHLVEFEETSGEFGERVINLDEIG